MEMSMLDEGMVMEKPVQDQIYDGEIFLYYGDIDRDGYDQVSTAYESLVKGSKKVCMILVTRGGDADAAYRIARASNHHFDTVEILIPDICKSAGTLLCMGAHRLIFGDRGELGPLDIQLSKPDELSESMSGLDIIQAINALQGQVLSSFRTYLVDIRFGSRITTKIAAEIATKLTEGFIAPIAARIDPMTWGEHQRAMSIAYEYGERLTAKSDALRPDALQRLIGSYPSHGFVIDRKEAAGLFNQVVQPEGPMIEIYNVARQLLEKVPYPLNKPPILINFKEFLEEINHEKFRERDTTIDETYKGNGVHNGENIGDPAEESRIDRRDLDDADVQMQPEQGADGKEPAESTAEQQRGG